MQVGEIALHWSAGGREHEQAFPCLNDALNKATELVRDATGTPLRLMNWLGEPAGQSDPAAARLELLHIARIRLFGVGNTHACDGGPELEGP